MAVLSPTARGQCVANELTKLTASDGAFRDVFGSTVSLSGNTAIVGARHVDDACRDPDDVNCNSGSAYIFHVDTNGNWVQVAELAASDAEAGDEFGNSVSLSGDTAIVGAHRSDQAGNVSGSAYIFRRDFGGPDNWGQVVELIGSDTAAFDAFARSVALSGDTAIVGASLHDHDVPISGSAYIFQRHAGGPENWGQVAELTATDPEGADFFGWSVALSGDTAIVGAWGNDDDGTESGSAYIFQRDFGGPDNWGEVVKVTASDADVLDWFGWSVAVSGDTAFVGAPSNNDACPGNVNCNSGSAYIFQRHISGPDDWDEVVKLTASDAAMFDTFAGAVSLSGDIAIAGATQDDDGGPQSGSAYIFQRDAGGTGNWGEVVKLGASDAAANDNFGSAVALDGETALVGAALDDEACPQDPHCDSGSAYVIGGLSDCNDNGAIDLCDIADGNSNDDNNNGIPDECESPPCPWDLDNTSTVGASDLLSLLVSWGPCKGCPADFDGNGNVGASDLLTLLANWGPCP
ncbi:MAG: FG-GAP repeat protein [Phycisphaerales bacterium]